jgi:hypothetical protein
MRTYKEYMREGNPLAKIHKTISSGGSVGTVSPETSETNTRKTKKVAHAAMKKTLRGLSDKGAISYTGPHSGRYKYSGTDEPAKEGSYVLKPGKDPKKAKHFEKILKAVGSRFKQQSVMKVDKKGGDLHYTDGEHKGEKEHLGKIHYNKKLKKGSGDTKMKGKDASFTVDKD